MKGVSFTNNNLGKREQNLVKAQKLSVPLVMIEPFIEFLGKQREDNQGQLDKAKDEELEAEMLLDDVRKKRYTIEQKQEQYDKNYQLAVNFKNNPDAEEFTFYQPAPQQQGEKAGPIVGSPNSPTITPADTTKKGGPGSRADAINWVKLAVTVLDRAGRFLEPREIIKLIFNQFANVKQRALVTYKTEGTAYALVLISFKQHCERVDTRRDMTKQFLVMYEGKVGLFKWVDKDKMPLSPYGKAFGLAYNSDNHLSVATRAAV
jgi:hypothetical protein